MAVLKTSVFLGRIYMRSFFNVERSDIVIRLMVWRPAIALFVLGLHIARRFASNI